MIAKIVSILNTAKQNQKFPFHFFFRFAVEGWGEETREKCKEIFWFLHTRVRERVRGALVRITTQSERTMQFQVTTRSARTQINRFAIGNRCELGTIETPIRNSKVFSVDTNGRRKAPTKDFLAGLQENSEFLARLRALIFCQEAGSKSEAILTHSICFGYKKLFYYYGK